MKERDVRYDLMRVVCMFMVIMGHAPVKPFTSRVVVYNAMMMMFAMCNGIFLMLSGKFNLLRPCNNVAEIRKFYKKRFISVVLPFVVVSVLMTLWHTLKAGSFVWTEFLWNAYRELMQDNQLTHLWFMYTLIGFMLTAPFLAKLLNALSDAEIWMLFRIVLIWSIVSVYLTEDLGIKFTINGWLLEGWGWAFFAGYFTHRVVNQKNKRWFYLAGIAGYVLSVAGRSLLGNNFKWWTDLHFGYILYAIGLFIFFENEIHVRNEWLKKFILFNARYSFLIYMIHVEFLNNVVLKIVTTYTSWLHFVETSILTYLISLAAAVLLDKIVIGPLKALAGRLLKV